MRFLTVLVLAFSLVRHARAATATSASDSTVPAETRDFGVTVTGQEAVPPSRTATGVRASTADLARLTEEERLALLQREARALSAADVVQLEAAVSATPDDVAGRAQLVAYYDTRKDTDPASRKRRLDHLYWLIRHHPESPASSNATTMVWRDLDGTSAVEAVSAEWMRQVVDHPGSTVILDHGADAMWSANPLRGLAWLADGEQITPKDPLWARRIGFNRYVSARAASDPQERSGQASEALRAYERALKLTPPGPERRALLFETAFAAWLAGRDDKAERYARDLLHHTTATATARAEYDNAVHQGNTVLGLVACRRKDLTAARNYLALSGDVHGTPALSTFGPEFSLAAALLEQGQRDAVDHYLEACGSFWDDGRDRLARWRAELAAGQTPLFTQHR